MSKHIGKSEFKPKAFEYLRYVAEKRGELIITEHGQPVAKIIPYQSSEKLQALKAMRGLLKKYVDPLGPATDPSDWNALK